MDAIERLRAKGLHDIANEFMRNRNELVVARRSLLVSHQINEEYRAKLEEIARDETGTTGSEQEGHRLIERCAELTQALDAMTAQRGDLENKLSQSNRSLMLAMRTAQEESEARARAERDKAQALSEHAIRQAALEEDIASLEARLSRCEAEHLAGAHQPSVSDQAEHDPREEREAARATIEALESRMAEQRIEIEAAAILRSENEALKRQIEALDAQHKALSRSGLQAQSEYDQAAQRMEALENEKSALEQQANMATQALRTLQQDLEASQRAAFQDRQDQVQLRARNAELAETIRDLTAQVTTLAQPVCDASCAPAPGLAGVKEACPASAYARRCAIGEVLEETVMKNIMPDAQQIQVLRACLDDLDGRHALDRLIEIEKGRMTHRILAAIVADREDV